VIPRREQPLRWRAEGALRNVPSPTFTSSASATPEEAAAIVAAIERFMRATAPGPARDAPARVDGWHATAMLEGVERDPWATPADMWLETGS
jgi:hypothetical protein